MTRVAIVCATLILVAAPCSAQNATATAEQHFALGWKAYEARRYDVAKRELEEATKLKRDYPDAYLALAMLARVQGKNREAKSQVDRAIQYRPEYAEALYLRARLRWEDGDFEHAREDVDAALRLDSKLYAAHALRGDLDFVDGDFESSSAAYETARTLAPKEFDGIERLRDNYAAVKSYTDFMARKLDADPEYKKPELLNRPMPRYTDKARAKGLSGTVYLVLRVDEQGQIVNILVKSGLAHGLTESAVTAARQIRMRPATIGGTPTASWLPISVGFKTQTNYTVVWQ